jgi:hypothetical protein
MDIRYVAGLFDGEGCIRVNRQEFPNHIRYQLYAVMQMSDPRPLAEMQKQFEGSFHFGKLPLNPNHRPLHCWSVSSQKALRFLEMVLPYLIVKKQEAELAIEFQRGIQRWGKAGMTEAEIARRHDLMRRISELKFVRYDPAEFGMVAKSGDTLNGQSRAKQRGRKPLVGVCNESTPPAILWDVKRDSDLRGNTESAAETTAPRELILAE